MSFEPPAQPPPPPPPAGPPPTGSPSGGWSPEQPPREPAFDPKSVNPLDWGILGVGLLTFIFSFFDYYSASISASYAKFSGGISESAGAWHFSHASFIAWFAMAFTVLGAASVALAVFGGRVQGVRAPRLLGLALSAAGSLLFIIAIFAHPKFVSASHGGFTEHFGHGFSFWVSLVFSLVITVLSLMRVQQEGQALPGRLGDLPNIGARWPDPSRGTGEQPPSVP